MMLMAASAVRRSLADLSAAAAAAATLARQHIDTVMAGRTLLQQAVPVTFGLVAANWLAGLDRARTTLAQLASDRLACQLGGAAGTLASLDTAGPRLVAVFAAETGLAAPDLPWHTERLRVVELAAALAGAGAALSKIARDVTLLAQSEVGEVAEGGDGAAGGSSAMPHKRNPVAAVVVLGCTKRLPGLLATIAAAAEQEHQRAAGGWHAEWETLADMLRLTSSAAAWSAELLTGLRVDTGRMRANLDAAGGLPLAEHVSALLAPHLGRLQARDLVARASRQVAAGHGNLADALLQDEAASASLASAGLTGDALRAALEPAGYLGATGAFIAAALAAHDRANREIG
jgi:3-carboxy-cis,cis-muconate cycloisomerase